MTFVDRINAALVRYLNEEVHIKAVEAEFDETNIPQSSGCDTCGYGSDYLSFDIRYKLDKDKHWGIHTEYSDPLSFLPTLLAFDTEE